VLIVFVILIAGLCFACQQTIPIEIEPHSRPPEESETITDQTEGDVLTALIDSEDDDWDIIEIFHGSESDSNLSFHVPTDKWRISCHSDTEYYEQAVFNIFISHDSSYSEPVEQISCLSDSESGSVHYYNGEGDYSLKVIAANLKTWTIVIEGYNDDIPRHLIQITKIHYAGTLYLTDAEECVCYERDEPDEYVVITNSGDGWEDVRGWVLKNITKGYPSFTFPQYFPCFPDYFRKYHKGDFSDVPSIPCILGPKQNVVVYTDELRSETGCFSFNFGTRDIWDNEVPDVAVLYDDDGVEISRKSYVIDTGK
jgi:hypothetical protein